MEEIYGYIERITFQNPENGFTIAQLKEPKKSNLTCIVGTMPSLQPGETVRCYGSWKTHLIHGHQFMVEKYQTEAPANIEGIKKYLGSGLIKGIGKGYAKRIVDKFGTETLHIIDRHPEKLSEVSGLGQKRMEKIASCWADQKSIREVMIFLQSYGVSPSFAQKIYKTYAAQSIQKVKSNPYCLSDIKGIGFKTADTIAQKLGIPKQAEQRIEAGIEFVLDELSGNGHVCYPLEEFIKSAEEILESPPEAISQRIQFLQENKRIEIMDLVFEGQVKPFIWRKTLFASELGIARELKRLRDELCLLRAVDIPKAIDWVQKQHSIQLAENQQKAVAAALVEKIQIITGGPGTGKSTITKAIISITEKLTQKIVLAAPTGRAAKRMAEITGKKASTIHSLLEFDFKNGGFKRKRENPLECDLIIIDEASMIDTYLMYSLLKAIPSHARVVFVGDINQLPSVGPGNVLKDLIQSHALPVTMLNEIFRQATGSRIIVNAHKINRGDFPDIRNLSDSDFYFIEAATPEKVLENIITLVSHRIPVKYKFDPLNDIQVLAPMKRGVIGTENLNQVLQASLNPNKEAHFISGSRFQEGDKVMQLRNDYNKEVFNGDIGRVTEIDAVDQQVLITFDEREVIYEFNELDDVALAYAVSVHKYQGSECPCVIMPIHTTHFKLLHRNLLYTGVTRGKKLVILVGTTQALYIAVKNDEVRRRYSGLQQATSGILNPQLLKI